MSGIASSHGSEPLPRHHHRVRIRHGHDYATGSGDGALSLVQRRRLHRHLRVYFAQTMLGDALGKRGHLQPQSELSALSATADLFAADPTLTLSRRDSRAVCPGATNSIMHWHNPGPVRRPPGFIEPCLPTNATTVPTGCCEPMKSSMTASDSSAAGSWTACACSLAAAMTGPTGCH